MEWIIKNWMEIFAALSGICYVYYEIKQKAVMWLIGFLSSAVYVYVFFNSKFYADSALYLYYVIISIYGWFAWTRHKKPHKKATDQVGKNSTSTKKIGHISLRYLIFVISTAAILFVVIGYVLDHFTDSPVPYFDAFSTALSIVATWMITQKYIEHWYFWMLINSYCVPLYIWRGLYPTAALFLLYAVLSWVGLKQWRKQMNADN